MKHCLALKRKNETKTKTNSNKASMVAHTTIPALRRVVTRARPVQTGNSDKCHTMNKKSMLYDFTYEVARWNQQRPWSRENAGASCQVELGNGCLHFMNTVFPFESNSFWVTHCPFHPGQMRLLYIYYCVYNVCVHTCTDTMAFVESLLLLCK